MQLTNKDEGLHPHGDAENWQESCVLAWRDSNKNIGGNHRISIQPNRGVSNLWCAVFHERDKVYRLNLEKEPFIPMAKNVHGFQCGPQRMFHDGEHLRVQIDQPECKVDLIVEDFKDSVESFDDGGGMSTVVYRSHFNMHARVHGSVVLNGESHEIDGLGWRDHSWGPRDWDKNLGHRSFHGNFGPDLNFHLLCMLTADGTVERRGHLVRDGKPVAFESFTTRVEILEDGITPVRGHCHIVLPDGDAMDFTCIVQKGVQASVEMYQGFFGVGECHFEGRTDGFCNFEMTNNPRLGTRPLGVALGNTLENGFHQIDIEPWKYEPL